MLLDFMVCYICFIVSCIGNISKLLKAYNVSSVGSKFGVTFVFMRSEYT